MSGTRRIDGGGLRRALAVAAVLAGGVAPLAAIGDLDVTFGDYGLVRLAIGTYGAAALAGVRQPDGKLVLAGSAGDDFAIARLLESGEPDPTFGGDGVSTLDFFGLDDSAASVVLQPDGKLTISGSAGNPFGTRNIAIARFKVDGTLDSGFGDAGRVIVASHGGRDDARSMVQLPDGDLMIAGGTTDSSGSTNPILVRVNEDGSLDRAFGAEGIATFAFPNVESSWFNDVKLDAAGRLVVAASALASAGWDMLVARVLANGELDTAFAQDGVRTIDGAGADDEALSLAIQPDDRIVLGGFMRQPGSDSGDALLVRLDGNGNLDDGFGIGGIATVDLGGDCRLLALALDTNGKIVASGALGVEATYFDAIVARFNVDGSIDASFGSEGIEIVDYGKDSEAALSEGDALIRESDGRYVVVGTNSWGRFMAARFDDAAEFAGRIGFTRTHASIGEARSRVAYTVRRTGGRSGPVGVSYATTAREAKPGLDYESTSGVLTWVDGGASDRTILINVVDDAYSEPDESFGLALSEPTGGARLAASEASTTITSDDGPGSIRVQYVFDVLQVGENAGTIHIPVIRTGGSQGAVGVSYFTSSGSAKANSDFATATGKLHWADGEAGTKSIPVRILQDSLAESREAFSVCLKTPTGGAVLETFGSQQHVYILDDDAPPSGGGPGASGPCSEWAAPPPVRGGSDAAGGGGGGGFGALALAWLALLFLVRHRGVQSR
jgi:uncharacterized delta-60 repeat protein